MFYSAPILPYQHFSLKISLLLGINDYESHQREKKDAKKTSFRSLVSNHIDLEDIVFHLSKLHKVWLLLASNGELQLIFSWNLLYLIILIFKSLYFIYFSFIKCMRTAFSKQWRITVSFSFSLYSISLTPILDSSFKLDLCSFLASQLYLVISLRKNLKSTFHNFLFF